MITISNDAWEIRNISGVVFDKDGTLIDSHIYWGRIIEKRARSIMGTFYLPDTFYDNLCLQMGYSTSSRRLLPEGPIALVGREVVINILCDYLKSINVDTDEDELSEIFISTHMEFEKEMPKYVHILPGVKNFIQELINHNIKLSLVTSDSLHLTNQILYQLKIKEYFEIIIGKESTKESKSTGVPATKAVEAMKLDPNKVICVGDAPVDAIMAKKSGLQACICITTGQTGQRELQEHSPYIIETMEQLRIGY